MQVYQPRRFTQVLRGSVSWNSTRGSTRATRRNTLDRGWIRGVIVFLYRPVKIRVTVTPKRNVLDPQGAAVGHALESLGLRGLKGTRVGKVIELEVEGAADTAEVRGQLDRLCRDLLSNPVIEDYRYEIAGS